MTQVLSPASLVSAGSWGTSTYTNLQADDGSYCISEAVGSGPISTLEVSLDVGTDPVSSDDHVIRVRWYASGGGGAYSNPALCDLVQGTTVIATLDSGGNIGTSEVEDTYTLSGTEADSITDYSDLRLRLRSTDTRRSLYVDLAQLEIPDASAPTTIDLDHLDGSQFFSPTLEGVGVIDLDHLDGSQFFSLTVAALVQIPGDLVEADVIGIWDGRNLVGSVTDPISAWVEELGNQSDIVASGSKRATINESGFDGIRAALFDGSDDFMTVTLDQSYTGDFAIICVMEWVTVAGTDQVVYSTGSVPDKNILGQDPPNGWVVMSGDGTGPEHHTGTNDLTYFEDTPSRFVTTQYIQNDNRLRLYENGVIAIDEAPASAGDLNNMGALMLGGREDESRHGNVRIAYIMLVDMTSPSLADLLSAQDELGSAFNVPGFGSSGIDLNLLDGSTFFSPTVADASIDLDHLDGSQFFSPTIGDGSVELEHVDTSTFFSITVEAGTGDLDLDTLDGSQFFEPSLLAEVALVTLDGSQFFAPLLVSTIALTNLSGSQFFEPSLFVASIEMDHLDGTQFFAPSLLPGIDLDLLDSSEFFDTEMAGIIDLDTLDSHSFFPLTVVDPAAGAPNWSSLPLQGVEF